MGEEFVAAGGLLVVSYKEGGVEVVMVNWLFAQLRFGFGELNSRFCILRFTLTLMCHIYK